MIYELSKFSESCNLHDKCIIDMQVAAFRKVPNTLKFLKLFSSVKRQKMPRKAGHPVTLVESIRHRCQGNP